MREEIGRQIAELRQKRGLSQRKLAEMTGYCYSNIAKIEKGRYSVGIDILGNILRALDARIKIEEL